MPQEIVVLRCKECSFFQTHLSKKSIRYICKVCGEKQSISRIYAKGTGAECRRACQHLNNAVPFDGDTDDVDRELDRYEDEVHRLKIKSMKQRSDSPADQAADSDEMLANEEDCESEDPLTDTPSGSPDTDGHRDEGFEERNLIHEDCEAKSIEKVAVSGNLSDAAVSSSSAASLSAVSSSTDLTSPPLPKKSKYSLF